MLMRGYGGGGGDDGRSASSLRRLQLFGGWENVTGANRNHDGKERKLISIQGSRLVSGSGGAAVAICPRLFARDWSTDMYLIHTRAQPFCKPLCGVSLVPASYGFQYIFLESPPLSELPFLQPASDREAANLKAHDAFSTMICRAPVGSIGPHLTPVRQPFHALPPQHH